MNNHEPLDTTVGQWRAEMHRLNALSDMNGLTIAELIQSLDLTRWGVNELIRQLTAIGRCKSGTATRKGTTGRSYHVAVYQLTPKKEKE